MRAPGQLARTRAQRAQTARAHTYIHARRQATRTHSEHTDTCNSQQNKNKMKKTKKKQKLKILYARTRAVGTHAGTQSTDIAHSHIYTRTPTDNTHAQRAHRHLQFTTK